MYELEKTDLKIKLFDRDLTDVNSVSNSLRLGEGLRHGDLAVESQLSCELAPGTTHKKPVEGSIESVQALSLRSQ